MFRRSVKEFDWSTRDQPRWIVWADEWHRPLKVRKVEPGADLIVAFLEEALAVHQSGWRLGELTLRFGWFLGHKGIKTLLRVDITDQDPSSKVRV